MLKEFIEKIQSDTHAEIISDGQGGLVYYTHPVFLPPAEPLPTPLVVHSLSGLVGYATSHHDAWPKAFCYVESPTRVQLLGPLMSRGAQRNVYCVAEAIVTDTRNEEHYLAVEDFLLWLMTGFEPNEHQKILLHLVGNLTAEAVSTHQDDGVTQTVTARTGIAKVDRVPVPNPVVLKPYRTFSEISQPECLYVVRVKMDSKMAPTVGLWEVRNARWQHDRMLAIAEYLSSHFEDILVIA